MPDFLLSPNKRDQHDPLVLKVEVLCPRCSFFVKGPVDDPTSAASIEASVRQAAHELNQHFCDPDSTGRGRKPQKKPAVQKDGTVTGLEEPGTTDPAAK